MKTIFNLTTLIALIVLGSNGMTVAQEDFDPKTPFGFVRLANAVARGTGDLKMEVNGSAVSSEGYKLGDVTGGIRLKPGSHEIEISREGIEPGKTKINVALNDTTILIPFAEEVPASDTKPAHWEIRILRLKQLEPESGLIGTFVSVSRTPEVKIEMREPAGKWNTVTIKRLATAQSPILYPRGYVPLRSEGRELEPIPVSDQGNYVVLLYDDENGKIQTVNFRDYKFLSAE